MAALARFGLESASPLGRARELGERGGGQAGLGEPQDQGADHRPEMVEGRGATRGKAAGGGDDERASAVIGSGGLGLAAREEKRGVG